MEIRLGALEHNARVIRAALPKRVKLMAVVKADAYGHGLSGAAGRMAAAGADMLAVAIVEEARVIRECGLQIPVLVLGGGEADSIAEAVELGAAQTVYTPEMLYALDHAARSRGVIADAHLKIDSGMSRIGARGDRALARMLEAFGTCENVRMRGLFTHFCAAEDDPEYTAEQNARFLRAAQTVRAAGYRPLLHAAATAAALNPAYQHDMVRPGLGLYGFGMPALKEKLKMAQRLVTRPVRIESIEPGDTVSYGRIFTAERATRVMTLPIGYGDGYPRALGNRADVLIRGGRAKVIGRVCMDMIMADVTDIPGAQMGDEVVLMGAQGADEITPEELAEKVGTISYEIMLGFAPRVKREIVL